jgi:hypothetical protein
MYLSPEARRASTAEAFDEFASLALLQSCYAVSLATRNTAWMGALMESFAVQQSASGVTDRMAALNTRMALAELRLHCLENRKQPTEMSALRYSNPQLTCPFAFHNLLLLSYFRLA